MVKDATTVMGGKIHEDLRTEIEGNDYRRLLETQAQIRLVLNFPSTLQLIRNKALLNEKG